jgi:hypothetical protein
MSVSESVGDIPTSGLTRSDYFHDLATLHTIIAGDRVFHLNLGELSLFHSVLGKKLILLLISEEIVLGNKLMLCNVDQELLLEEKLNFTGLKILQFLQRDKYCCKYEVDCTLTTDNYLLCDQPKWYP